MTNGSGLSVNIAVGRAYLLASGGNGYPVISDSAITNQAISANSSGNPRITSVVLYKDLTISPNADDTNSTFITTVDGTPAASPSAPSAGTIQSAVGASNPYFVVANVLVNSGATAPTSIDQSVMPVALFAFSTGGDGWISAGETWTYASSTTFTVSGDVSNKYGVGDKIKLVQSSSTKYFYITGVSYSSGTTTITITGGTSYTLANSSISNNYYSKADNPQNFPSTHSYTPTWTGFSSTPPGGSAKFHVIGRRCFVDLYGWSNGVSNATDMSISLPIASASDATAQGGPLVDNTLGNIFGYGYITGSSISFYSSAADGGWVNSGNKNIRRFSFSYPI